jgi:hypothetical protein
MFFEDLGFDDFLTKFCRMNLEKKVKYSPNRTSLMLDGLSGGNGHGDGLSLTTLETTLES